ncbi:FxSxx-COOH system tetratricopeptide repeat protein [Streptomyces sp. DSM 40907]|uniref:FxSxx-COOH system tetratricopeptide repeat protein n=1 Tax=Streptomyces kutzneri TaxID=3051179 RepID=UPI0028D29F7D|nr:FxSxx-COOH system tetratricopeptide repeat protein [Streptomyces sp. DSM 40907]
MSAAGALAVCGLAVVTNYVTSQVPGWVDNPSLIWGVFAVLVAVSVGLQLWSRRLDAGGGPGGTVRLVPVDRVVAAAATGSLAAPRLRSAVHGRVAELGALARLLHRPGGRFAVVCGTGGIGKTTLAAAVAEHAAGEGHAVFWVTWFGPEQFAEDMLRVAVACGIPEETVEAARARRAPLTDVVWKQLAARGKWLLVLDNFDDPEALGPDRSGPPADYRGWVRPAGGGLLLVTSRDTRTDTWGPDAVLTRLDALDDEPGASVLLDLAPDAGSREDAARLAARLGGLPLALQAAGRYLAAAGSRYRAFRTYTTALDTDLGTLLAAEHARASDPVVARSVVRYTWDLSLDQLARDGNALARPVLRLLSLLAPVPVPLSFLTPDLLRGATGLRTDPVRVEAAVNGLHAYGLLQAPNGAGEPGQVVLHPLVREITAHTLFSTTSDATPWRRGLARQLGRSVDAVRAAGPGGWPLGALLVPHALVVAAFPGDDQGVVLALDQLAEIQSEAGRPADTVMLCEVVLEICARRHGSEHSDTLNSRNTLAQALQALGRHQEAADFHARNIATRERVLGPDHPDTLVSRNNLGVALNDLGRTQEAADLHTRNLAALERALGPGHPHTLTSRNNLAYTLRNLGRRQEAADLHTATLAVRERVLGPDHPHTLTSRTNLAYTLDDLGRHQEAFDLHTRNLAALEGTLGADHPEVLISRNNLAISFGHLGRYQEAADLHAATVVARERVLGPDHPDTLISRNNLAAAVDDLGRHQEAADLHAQNLAASERVVGPDHPDTLTSRNNLATALGNLGRHQEAADHHTRNLAALEVILGPDHPDTLTSRNNLAVSLDHLGRRRQAADLHAANLAARERVLGPDHPDSLISRNNLAAALNDLGRHREAADLHAQNLAASERALGPDHPDTLISRNNLAGAERRARASRAADRIRWRARR